MKTDNTFAELKKRIAVLLKNEGSGHGFDHIERVYNNALLIAETENANREIVMAAALLHDAGDHKLNPEGKEMHREMIVKLAGDLFNSDFLEEVIFIVERVSFKGAGVDDLAMPIEGKIVRDADRLDAIGAIGIARAFAYGGNQNRSLYDPKEDPELHNDFEKYKNSDSSTLNHFHEKLFLLKDRMETSTANIIAKKRHAYMEEFVQRFKEEWNGVQ